jgi:hypothetical protein
VWPFAYPKECPRRESNPDRAFRKRLFYPLNYEDAGSSKLQHARSSSLPPPSRAGLDTTSLSNARRRDGVLGAARHEEFSGGDSQRLRKAVNVLKRDITFSALNPSDVTSIEIALQREVLLRKSGRLSQLTKSFSERAADFRR